jgi:transposase InsO family protein
MDAEVRRRLGWVRLYEQTGDAGLVCRRCGISRPTLRKWWRRYQTHGEKGLFSQSRRPHHTPGQKVFEREQALILELRQTRNLGARRLQNELRRQHDLRLSLETIHKVLDRAQVKPLVRPPRRKGAKRYARPTPGERVQMDTCKIAPGCYQYTAVDDCTRYRVLAVFSRRTATNTLTFLDQVIEEMPFPIQRVQTDRGREFFALSVQRYLMEHCIKFRPIKPRSPHLNGKVERSQRTDLEEFWATTDPKDPEIELRLAEWQHYYNWERPHGSLQGNTPMERFFEKIDSTPLLEQIEALYEPAKERLREADYRQDQLLHQLHLQAMKPPEQAAPEVAVAD